MGTSILLSEDHGQAQDPCLLLGSFLNSLKFQQVAMPRTYIKYSRFFSATEAGRRLPKPAPPLASQCTEKMPGRLPTASLIGSTVLRKQLDLTRLMLP